LLRVHEIRIELVQEGVELLGRSFNSDLSRVSLSFSRATHHTLHHTGKELGRSIPLFVKRVIHREAPSGALRGIGHGEKTSPFLSVHQEAHGHHSPFSSSPLERWKHPESIHAIRIESVPDQL
jgi:hypothetical protein